MVFLVRDASSAVRQKNLGFVVYIVASVSYRIPRIQEDRYSMTNVIAHETTHENKKFVFELIFVVVYLTSRRRQ